MALTLCQILFLKPCFFLSKYSKFYVFHQHVVKVLNQILCFHQHKKIVTHFWHSVNAILEDVSVNEIIVWCWNINPQTDIFQCSTNYSGTTCAIRLQVAPNIAVQSVLIKTDRSLKCWEGITITKAVKDHKFQINCCPICTVNLVY